MLLITFFSLNICVLGMMQVEVMQVRSYKTLDSLEKQTDTDKHAVDLYSYRVAYYAHRMEVRKSIFNFYNVLFSIS